MDYFKAAGDNERQKMTNLFEQFGITSYVFTKSDGYDRVEGYYTGKTGNEYVFEVKCRDIATTAYTQTIIEKKKVDAVLEESDKSNHKPILFFFFTDGNCMFQRLDKETYYSTINLDAPATTMGYNNKVTKQFVPFNITTNKLIKLN